VNGQDEKSADAGGTGHALMAELVALRADPAQGAVQAGEREKPTAEEMQRLIDRADADKLKKARERLAQAAEPEGQPGEKS